MGKSHSQVPLKRRAQGRATIATGSETRRANLRRLMDQMGTNQLARSLGYANASFLNQMAGPNPIRGVTEKTARRFEAALGMPQGTLDEPMVLEPAPSVSANGEAFSSPSQGASVDLTADVIRLVGRLFDEEGVDLSVSRFADVVALAVMDAVEHENHARPEHVRSLVRLVKPQCASQCAWISTAAANMVVWRLARSTSSSAIRSACWRTVARAASRWAHSSRSSRLSLSCCFTCPLHSPGRR